MQLSQKEEGKGVQGKPMVGRDLDFTEAAGEEKDDKVEGRQPGRAPQRRREEGGKRAVLSGQV